MHPTRILAAALIAVASQPALAAAPDEKAPSSVPERPVAGVPIQPYDVTAHGPLERATGWLGHPVLSADGQTLGPVEELILGEGGTLTGVVIALGGVLGFGATPVFVPFAEIAVAVPEDGPPELRTDATAEEIARLVAAARD